MDQVEEIKGKVDVVELVQEYVPLKRAGRNFKGLCPFHGEKTPSFMVNPELQIFKCFGCGLGGDCYTFLQKIEGMEFGEALQHLAKRVGITLVSYRPTQGEEIKERLIKINTMAAEFYHYLLTKHKIGKTALEYVKERGIKAEAVEKFKLGYAPEGWDYLGKFLAGKKGHKTEDLERAGLVVPGKRYDRFRNRLMFPINNPRGLTVGFSGRVLPGADEKAGGKYVNTPETEVFHKSDLLYGLDVSRAEIKAAGWAVAVEGQMDVIASWQAGVRNVVGVGGTALTERQVELLRRLGDTIVLALDTDWAGDAAARRGIEMADRAGLMVKMVRITGAKDPGELATASPEEWKKAVLASIPIYDFYLRSAVERYGLEVEGKKRIGQELLPIWVNIADEIVKAHYVKVLGKTLGVDEQDVRAQMAKLARKGRETEEIVSEKATNARDEREKYAVKLAILGEKVEELAEMPLVTSFWVRVREELQKKKKIADLPAELRERVEELLMTEEEFSDKGWEEAKRRLELLDIEEKVETQRGQPEEIRKLAHRKDELTKER